ncbi:MAG: hypothetical protein P8Y70_19515 [Candidatus Lokiarchaeota archaeon]
MSFVKSFFAGIVTFLGLSIVFFLIYYGISGDLVQRFGLMGSYYYIIFEFLAMPLYYAFTGLFTPSNTILSFVLLPGNTNLLLTIFFYLGILVPPIVASLVAGRLAENKVTAFLSWMVISIIMSILGFFGYFFGYVVDMLRFFCRKPKNIIYLLYFLKIQHNCIN